MGETKQLKGKCNYCGHETTKSTMTRHLSVCKKRNELIEMAEKKKPGNQLIYHLRVQDTYRKEFWLDLEMRGSTSLENLDDYLRAIWLECCGHLSEFTIGGWRGRKISMKSKADDIFEKGLELIHIYDFGTSSMTKIKVISSRIGNAVTAHPITLMSRNLIPEAKCIECNKAARWLCIECLYEDEIWGTLCDLHSDTHPHNNYDGPIPLVNSPRMGMCGYTGPAEPPYK